ncbi:MAG: HAD family hydrolase [Granulosicoccus sp.]
MSIQNIIFDWDGTLARTLELWLNGYQLSFARRDLKFQPKEIVAEFFHNHDDVPEKHPDIDFPAIAEETRDHVFHSANTVNLYDGAVETLAILKGNKILLSVVSSSSRSLLNKGVDAHQLDSYFMSTVAGDDGYGHKPDTLPFKETLNRMGVSAADTLIIGDSHVDILAGMAIGCQTCLFTPPQNSLFHNLENLKSMNADHEIDNLPGLLQLV